MSEPPFPINRAHRWFAVELNNLAWKLVESPSRSTVENERMIHAAHAACFHWLEVGDLLNHLRAECLLGTAYTKTGFTEAAVKHAERCLSLSDEAGNTQTPFDRATAHGCASAAYELAGRVDDAVSQHQLARVAAERFDHPSEAPLFERLYPTPSR